MIDKYINVIRICKDQYFAKNFSSVIMEHSIKDISKTFCQNIKKTSLVKYLYETFQRQFNVSI